MDPEIDLSAQLKRAILGVFVAAALVALIFALTSCAWWRSGGKQVVSSIACRTLEAACAAAMNEETCRLVPGVCAGAIEMVSIAVGGGDDEPGVLLCVRDAFEWIDPDDVENPEALIGLPRDEEGYVLIGLCYACAELVEREE